MRDRDARLRALGQARSRVAFVLTALMVVLFFGFIALVAWNKPLLGTLIAPGLSLGILLGALVIVLSWLLAGVYTRWANHRFDTELDRLRQ